jgi:HD-GYP domain-containing protein (c-di-GMP phosphodiesterase class II)
MSGDEDLFVPSGESDFFPVSPLMIFPETQGNFEIYVEIDGLYLLYTRQKEQLSEEKKRKLHEDGVKSVYILKEQRQGYDDYVRANLGDLLQSPDVPLKERAVVLYNASTLAVEKFFDASLPTSLKKRRLREIIALVRDSLAFLCDEQAFKKIASLISRNYHLYAHSVNVFVLTAATLQTYKPDRKLLLNAGVGALLHDIGKLSWTKKQFERENARQSETDKNYSDPHPAVGAAYCAALPLSRSSLACILLHHEHEDGAGYPAKVSGEEIPFPVKVLSLVNAYDRLTSNAPGCEGMKPFDALRFIKTDMRGAFDPEIYKRFVMVLADAEIT